MIRISRTLICMFAVGALAISALADTKVGTAPGSGTPANLGSIGNLLLPPGTGNGTTLVDFFKNGSQEQHNDDYSSASIPLPFTFDLYGATYNALYINNNGNLTFTGPVSTYSPTGFPYSTPMVAPFWGDVDTGSSTNPVGEVYQEFFGTNMLVTTWDNVGFYSENGTLRNTFQVAVSDGTNPSIGIGNTVAFSYDDMEWTTGDASSGVNGFGGSPATVGINKGDGTNFAQIGRFDHAGSDWDGAYGSNDGVSWLDGQTILFDTSSSTPTTNLPPVAVGNPGAVSVDAFLGETLDIDFTVIGPESGDAVDVTLLSDDGALLAGLSVTITDGDPATVELDWIPDLGDVGSYLLSFSFEDSLAATSGGNILINVTPEPATMSLLALGGLAVLKRRRRK